MIYHDLEYLLKSAQVLQSRSWRSNMLVEKKGPRFKFNGNSGKAKHLFDFLFGGWGGGILLKQKTYESLDKNDSHQLR